MSLIFSAYGEYKPQIPSVNESFFKSLIDKEVLPGVPTLIPTGIKTEFPPNKVLLISNLPDSNTFYNDHIRVLAGVIDSDYRGHVQVLLINCGTESISISKSQIVAKVRLMEISTEEFKFGEVSRESLRGEKGFGSTGKK